MPFMSTTSIFNNYSNKTISCGNCNFQRQCGKTGKGAEKWAKMMKRLHSKVCPNTGRTEDAEALSHNRSGEVSLAQGIAQGPTPQTRVDLDTEHQRTTYSKIIVRG